MDDRTACACCGAPLEGARALGGVDRLHGTPGSFAVVRCRACAAGTTIPRLSPADLTALYPEGYAPYGLPRGVARLASRAIQRLQARAALRSGALRALRGRSAGRGVDVGCGRGDLAAALARRGWRMTGVEPSPAACAVAAGRGLDARRGTLETVALEPEAYDLALFNHSLEHVEDPVADLRRAAAALRPGGLVLVTVPNFGGWQAAAFGSRWFHLDLPRHRTHFTAAGMRAALARAGLEAIELFASSSSVGLGGSLQYRLAGRCLFPTGTPLRAAVGASAALLPLVRLGDRLASEGDLLHAVAARARGS